MVRHDPMNNRGPTPKGGRPAKVSKIVSASPANLFELSPITEYEKLWEAAIVQLDIAVLSIETYTKIGLPGANVEDLEGLADRLTKLREGASK